MNATTDSKQRVLRGAAALTLAAATAATLGGGVAAADPDTSKPSAAVSELLLNSSDFPSGYIIIPSPQQRLANELGADPLTLVSSANVKPEECKTVLSALKNANENDLNSIAGLNDADRKTLSETLIPQQSDVDTLKAGLLKTCSDVTIETKDPKGGEIKVNAKTKEIDSSSQKASFEIALDGTRTEGTQTIPIKQKVYFGAAALRGYTVAVQATKLSGDPDRGEFDSFFDKSVKKLQDAK